MKNIFKVIIFALLFSCLSLSAFASNTVKISDDGITETQKNVDVNFIAEGFSEGDDLTILVFKVTEELSTPHFSNIVYLEQPEYREDMQSISFTLPEDAEGVYEVRVGGNNVNQYTVGKFSVSNILKGDLNNDGIVDKNDAVMILKVFFGELIIENKADYDLINDGNINVKDAVELLKMIK